MRRIIGMCEWGVKVVCRTIYGNHCLKHHSSYHARFFLIPIYSEHMHDYSPLRHYRICTLNAITSSINGHMHMHEIRLLVARKIDENCRHDRTMPYTSFICPSHISKENVVVQLLKSKRLSCNGE